MCDGQTFLFPEHPYCSSKLEYFSVASRNSGAICCGANLGF